MESWLVHRTCLSFLSILWHTMTSGNETPERPCAAWLSHWSNKCFVRWHKKKSCLGQSWGSRLSPLPYRQIKIKKWMAGTSLDVSSDISVACKPLRWAGTCMDNQLLWNMFGKNQLLRLALRNRMWPHTHTLFFNAGDIFSCTYSHTSCYARDIFSCTHTHTSFYARDIFSCTNTHTSCYATDILCCTCHMHTCFFVSLYTIFLALPHILEATPHRHLFLHIHTEEKTSWFEEALPCKTQWNGTMGLQSPRDFQGANLT